MGRRFTGTSRQRRYFRRLKDAREFVLEADEARYKLGCEAFVLPLSLRAEALACNRKLERLNTTLTQAVEFFIRNAHSSGAPKFMRELKEEFIKSRKTMNCRPRTIVQYESYLRVICEEFGAADVSKILRQDIEDWLEEADWSPRTRKNYLITCSTIFNFAVAKGFRLDNPAATIGRPILDDRPVGILTVEQAESLLRTAALTDSKMLPALTVGLFAGLRRSEFFALDWSEIDLEHRTIEVKGIKAKTRQRRLVHVSENLFEWLKPHLREKGPITPERNIDVFSERLRVAALRAEINPWPHNAMRHSFGSYFFAKTKDENLTASEMGNSPGVIFRHYRAVVKDADVAKYWGIDPKTVGKR